MTQRSTQHSIHNTWNIKSEAAGTIEIQHIKFHNNNNKVYILYFKARNSLILQIPCIINRMLRSLWSSNKIFFVQLGYITVKPTPPGGGVQLCQTPQLPAAFILCHLPAGYLTAVIWIQRDGSSNLPLARNVLNITNAMWLYASLLKLQQL